METNQVQHSLQSANGLIQAETIKGITAHVDSNIHPDMTEEWVRSVAIGDPDGTLQEVYNVARPVLTFLEGALFLAPGWHKALKALVAALDTITAVEPEQSTNKDESQMPL